MKGIVLAGGYGTRLLPITKTVSKHLLPIYDKPMIYYSLSVLMLAGINDILIITTKEHQSSFFNCLGNGSEFGIRLTYKIQDKPEGLAQAFIIGEEFIGKDKVCLILGDNIFWGQGFTTILNQAQEMINGATIFSYQVNDPQRFGVVQFDNNKKIISIEEKPKNPISNFAITGLYFYDNKVVDMAKRIVPSDRGELEIISLNQMYLEEKRLNIIPLGRGFAWFDTGTPESLLEAAMFVETIEKRQGFKIACLEEIGLKNGWLTLDEVKKSSNLLNENTYGKYLVSLVND